MIIFFVKYSNQVMLNMLIKKCYYFISGKNLLENLNDFRWTTKYGKCLPKRDREVGQNGKKAELEVLYLVQLCCCSNFFLFLYSIYFYPGQRMWIFWSLDFWSKAKKNFLMPQTWCINYLSFKINEFYKLQMKEFMFNNISSLIKLVRKKIF